MATEITTIALNDGTLDAVTGAGLTSAIAMGLGFGAHGAGCGGIAAGPAGAVVCGLVGAVGGFVIGMFTSDAAPSAAPMRAGGSRRVVR